MSAIVQEAQVAIKVEDTGIGIPEDKLSFVWKAFSQVDMSITRKYGGTGLGLSVVKELAEAHGGTVSVSSVSKGPSTGTSFTVLLPLRQKHAGKNIDEHHVSSSNSDDEIAKHSVYEPLGMETLKGEALLKETLDTGVEYADIQCQTDAEPVNREGCTDCASLVQRTTVLASAFEELATTHKACQTQLQVLQAHQKEQAHNVVSPLAWPPQRGQGYTTSSWGYKPPDPLMGRWTEGPADCPDCRILLNRINTLSSSFEDLFLVYKENRKQLSILQQSSSHPHPNGAGAGPWPQTLQTSQSWYPGQEGRGQGPRV